MGFVVGIGTLARFFVRGTVSRIQWVDSVTYLRCAQLCPHHTYTGPPTAIAAVATGRSTGVMPGVSTTEPIASSCKVIVVCVPS